VAPVPALDPVPSPELNANDDGYLRLEAALTQTVDFIFVGMACFVPQERTRTYRVLFPEGLNGGPGGVTPHLASIWIRGDDHAIVNGPWLGINNLFVINNRSELRIGGIKQGTVTDTNFVDRVPYLVDADSSCTFDSAPDTIISMDVDGGALSSHQMRSGMIVVRWRVEGASEMTPITINRGSDSLELHANTREVLFINASSSNPFGTYSHFSLYRKLSTVRTGQLDPPALRATPDQDGDAVLGQWFVIMTPDYGCSPGSGSGAGP